MPRSDQPRDERCGARAACNARAHAPTLTIERLLGRVARLADKNRKQVAKEGGIDLILDSLRNGAGTPNLLMAAAWAISNLTAFGACHDGPLRRAPVPPSP